LIRRVDPEKDLLPGLLGVEKPARYSGGEFGSVVKPDARFRVGIGFPDLYEIGMSNLAMRILYRGLNALDGVACERFFAPAPDFESLLRRLSVPLYGLESGTPLGSMDLLGFSVGYELCGTGILSALDLSGIPLLAGERGSGDPVVIAGGPGVTNPRPFAPFLDGVWIGEAEAGFFALVSSLAEAKGRGAGRGDLLAILGSHPAVWRPGKKAVRAVHSLFSSSGEAPVLPVPSLRPVQDHGVVEIMRGCPNGCRFCHAGYAYRPARPKAPELVLAECLAWANEGGYREVSLSSLSSADYPGIDRLMRSLAAAFTPRRISLQLPSLRVDAFTLPLLKTLSDVRKSGITLAVETPEPAWRMKLNKSFDERKVFEILESAMASGWRRAKLYFMIGLPVGATPDAEADAILSFLEEASSRFRMDFSVNVGTFIPKPHTPYERERQVDPATALSALRRLKASVPRRMKLAYHDADLSYLEGLVSRGDESVSAVFLEAFRSGQRLEAWDEHRDISAWKAAISSLPEAARERPFRGFSESEVLPWSDVSILVSPSYLRREFERSESGELTSPCMEKCTERCGSCSESSGFVQNNVQFEKFDEALSRLPGPRESGIVRTRIVFGFTKEGRARFLSHLSLIETFSKAVQRAGLPIVFTQGFNPQPRIEILQALSLGVESVAEVASVFLSEEYPGFVTAMNESLPEGIRVADHVAVPVKTGDKIVSLNSLPYACDLDIASVDAIDISAFSNVESFEAPSHGSRRYRVRVGTGAEAQAFAFIKARFGPDVASWPSVRRVAAYTLGCRNSKAGDDDSGRNGALIGFLDFFRGGA